MTRNDLKRREQQLYDHLTRCALDGVITGSQSDIAEALGWHQQTVATVLSDLVRVGRVRLTGKGNSRIYHLDRLGLRCQSHERRGRARKNTTTRNCMCCDLPFDSQGIHNRLCNSCRQRASGYCGLDDCGPARSGHVPALNTAP